MKQIIIKGIVSIDEADQICIDDTDLRDILIEKLEELFNISINEYEDQLCIENAYISLFVADKEMPFDEMKKAKVLSDLGLTFNVDYVGYSEWTVSYFYIGTLTIGNHNLLDILRTMKNKYIVLTIESITK